MNSIMEIEKIVLENSTKQDREVKGLWGIDCFFNPAKNGRVFDYKILVSQTIGQGCAYSACFDYSRFSLKRLVGLDFSECGITDIALKVCFLDSIYGKLFSPINKKRLVCDFDSSAKMEWRTQIILEEATHLLGKIKGKKIVNIGVVGDILYAFKNNGAIITGTDFDSSIVGVNSFDDIPIFGGDQTTKMIEDSDLAIITGMTITTNTIDEIIRCCNNHGTKSIVFAETGANLANYYVKNGVNVYLSEYFPFYIFNGTSVIDVCYG